MSCGLAFPQKTSCGRCCRNKNLLIDRLKLKVHRETGGTEGDALAVAKSGVKFEETSDNENPVNLRAQNKPEPGATQWVTTVARGNFSVHGIVQALTIVLNHSKLRTSHRSADPSSVLLRWQIGGQTEVEPFAEFLRIQTRH